MLGVCSAILSVLWEVFKASCVSVADLKNIRS